MAAFAYRAVDAAGRPASGMIEAASASAARSALRARQLLPMSVEPAAAAGPGRLRSALAGPARGGIGLSALGLVTRQLATLVGSGVRIEEALRTLADQAGNARVSALMLTLRSAVLDGRSFAAALADHPGTFGEYYRASVAAGESAGQLGQVMEHLAAHVDLRARNRQTVQLALLYPAILAVVSLAVITALLVYVVPDIVRVFTARGADLPFLTRALIGASEGLTRFGPALALGLGAGTLAVLAALRRPAARLAWHRWLATSRLTRAFTLKSNAAQFTGTLATLTVSRVPLVEALRAAARTVPNLHIRAGVEGVTARVQEGAALSVALSSARVFPPILIAMVASGEAGGVLGATLSRAADDQVRDLNAKVAALVALVEPGVLLVMGGVVMLLVLAILLPIVNLNALVAA